jgi:hypothetical protein
MFLKSLRMQCALACALAITLGSSAAAATLTLDTFGRDQAGAAQSALAAFQAGAGGVRTETFDGHQAWNGKSGARNPSGTQVGSFSSLGGKGRGASAINGGAGLQVRGDGPKASFGRFGLAGGNGNWLDSNDTAGIRWNVSAGGGGFNALAFLLTDVADVGAVFSIKVGETLFSQVVGAAGRTANGSIHLVRVLLPRSVDNLMVELRNDRLNDGFGIDGATVAQVAPVPLPPAALLLLSGGAALAALRRRAA